MTKQQVEEKIKEILSKDDRFINSKVVIELKEKNKIYKILKSK